MGFGGMPWQRKQPPPAPYTGTWYFYLFMTIRPGGELYIGLGNSTFTKAGIYRTLDFGDNWTQVLDHDDFGGEKYPPLHLLPTSAKLLVAVWDRDNVPNSWSIYQAASIAGPWTLVLGGVGAAGLYRGYPNLWRLANGTDIWVTGQTGAGAARTVGHYSSDQGDNWAAIYTLNSSLNYGQIRVNPGGTKGLVGGAGALAVQQDRRSDNPTATPGTWSTLGILARGYRFGVSWPYCVMPENTRYWYSSDNGASGATKVIPAAMQTVAANNYLVGLSMSPFDRNRILSATPGGNKGVWLSRDYGDSWEKVHDNLGAVSAPFLNSVMFDLYHDRKAYAWGVAGFYRSDDAGETWQARSNGLELGQV